MVRVLVQWGKSLQEDKITDPPLVLTRFLLFIDQNQSAAQLCDERCSTCRNDLRDARLSGEGEERRLLEEGMRR